MVSQYCRPKTLYTALYDRLQSLQIPLSHTHSAQQHQTMTVLNSQRFEFDMHESHEETACDLTVTHS